MDNKTGAYSLASLIFAVVWAVCGPPQIDHESMLSVPATAVSSPSILTHQISVINDIKKAVFN